MSSKRSRTPPKKRRPSSPRGVSGGGPQGPRGPQGPEGPEEQDLFQGIRAALHSDEPLDLLALVSGLLEVTDPRRADPFAGDDAEPGPNLHDLVDSFLGTPAPEISAVLAVIRALTPDELLAARIGRELARRRDRLPAWLQTLGSATLQPDVWFLTHVLGDGDDYLYGVTLPTGEELSALVYVDHNLGGVVKDAFIAPTSLVSMTSTISRETHDPDQTLRRVDPAEARAAVEQAIERGAMTYPPLESDSWPMCRPLIEWMLRMLPTGGDAPRRPVWNEPERDALKDGFFASAYGSGLDDDDHRALLESVLWYATDYGPGDPLRWSAVKLEILLLDWFPRKVIADRDYLSLLPGLLEAFIPYAHERAEVREELTRDALSSLATMTPDYLGRIGSAPTSPADQLAALLGAYGVEGDISGFLNELGLKEDGEQLSWQQMMLQDMEEAVGGAQQLQNLDTDPLPDEPFAWDDIAEDIRPVVSAMLADCDRCADELLDIEHRTAMRRFLARAAAADPSVFRRRAATNRGAAAVAWVICRANGTAGTYGIGGALTSGELMEFFGVKGSASQRAEPLLKAIGVNPYGFGSNPLLGTPDLLVSSRRADLIERRRRTAEL